MSRLLNLIEPNIICEVDGFYYLELSGFKPGFVTSHDLREIADELDRRNKSWEESINKMCSEEVERREWDKETIELISSYNKGGFLTEAQKDKINFDLMLVNPIRDEKETNSETKI